MHTSILLLALSALTLLLGACETQQPGTPANQASLASPYLYAENTAPAGRLPDFARPLLYQLELNLDPRREDFFGKVNIDIELLRDTDVIWLHGKSLQVLHSSAKLESGEELSAQYQEILDSGVAAMRFPSVIPAGKITLKIQYGAAYDRNLTGLFKVEEQGEAYVLAKSESIQARRYMPGFDEPGMKASYDLRLTIPTGYQVIGNSPELHREKSGQGMETVSFARTRPMPTYLLSLAVGPFDVVERPAIPANEFRSEEIPLRGFARKGRGAELGYILDITPDMIQIFETELKNAYPFAKLDIVAAPQWPSGATELSAAITYREQLILVGDNPAAGARLDLVSVHAHELAHMWFGNLVTPPWWDDLWLKEGFATWGTPVALSIMEPERGHQISARRRAISAMKLDSLASTRAIREPVTDNHNIRNAYDAITYSKSLGVIHMVDQYFGPGVFRPALGRYIDQFRDRAADSDQFYTAVARLTDTPELTETFRSFVEQKGVPQITATLSCADGTVSLDLQQQRYRPIGSSIVAGGESWNIPLCVRTSTGSQYCAIMSEPTQNLSLPDGQCPLWVLPNNGGHGYFRWNLPEQQWRALLADFAQFSPTEALSIIDSALASFEVGQLPPDILWLLVEASSRSPERLIVTAPLGHLQRYSLHYFNAEQRSRLQQRLRQWYRPVLEKTAQGVDPEQQLLHARLLGFMALVARDAEVRAQLLARAKRFTGYGIETDSSALNSDLYESALTVAVQELPADFINHLLSVGRELDDPKFESASARALGGATDSAVLPIIHRLALSEDMGSRETFDLLARATANEPTREENWRWIRANFPAIVDKIPAQWRRRTPALAANFCDQEALAQLQQLFAEHAALTPGYERSMAQTQESIALCIALAGPGQQLADSLSQ